MDCLAGQLRRMMSGRLCVVGVGNPLKGDDGLGPFLVERLANTTSVDCINAGLAPENHLERIVKLQPDAVLFVDALDFGGQPGEVRLAKPKELVASGLSTHSLSIGMACQYLGERGLANIAVLGVQPENMDLDTPMTPSVSAAVERLYEILAVN